MIHILGRIRSVGFASHLGYGRVWVPPVGRSIPLLFFLFILVPLFALRFVRVLARNMVVDTRYYDILQIKADADELTIKKVLCFLLALSFMADLLLACRPTDAKLFWYVILPSSFTLVLHLLTVE